jgi:hypothetical protein
MHLPQKRDSIHYIVFYSNSLPPRQEYFSDSPLEGHYRCVGSVGGSQTVITAGEMPLLLSGEESDSWLSGLVSRAPRHH